MKTKQIHIPHPCSQSWAEMQATDQGRLCSHCQKTVIDFTSYDDQDFIAYFQQAKETPCGRLTTRQLALEIPARQMTLLQPVKLYRYLTTGLLSMASLPVVAQVKQATVMTENKEGSSEQVAGQTPAATEPNIVEIRGKVTDQNKEAIPGAIIKLMNTEYATYADIDGYFMLKITHTEKASGLLRVQCVGYETLDIALHNVQGNIPVILSEDQHVLTGDVVIIRRPNFWQRITSPFRRRY